MQPGELKKIVRAISAEVALTYKDDPKGELDWWIATALQREAMVVEVYKLLRLEQRIPDQAAAEAASVDLVRTLIGTIWAQESAHTALIGALRKVDDPARNALPALRGQIEGLMTAWATSNGVFGTMARAALSVARVVNVAPEFTAQLDRMSLGDFFRFSEELEFTAIEGYSRILQLLAERGVAEALGATAPLWSYHFSTTLAEERFHEAVFKHLPQWLKLDDREIVTLDVANAAAAIAGLAEQHLAVSRVSGLPAQSAQGRRLVETDGDALISDGGMKPFFQKYGIPFRIAASPVTALEAE